MMPKDGLDLARLWLGLALTDLRLVVLPHSLNRHLLFPGAVISASTPQTRTAARIFRLVRLVSLAARFPFFFNMSCLRRSLVLRSRLRSMGVSTRLVYGMRRDQGDPTLRAHAWLEAGDLRIDVNKDWFQSFTSPARVGL